MTKNRNDVTNLGSCWSVFVRGMSFRRQRSSDCCAKFSWKSKHIFTDRPKHIENRAVEIGKLDYYTYLFSPVRDQPASNDNGRHPLHWARQPLCRQMTKHSKSIWPKITFDWRHKELFDWRNWRHEIFLPGNLTWTCCVLSSDGRSDGDGRYWITDTQLSVIRKFGRASDVLFLDGTFGVRNFVITDSCLSVILNVHHDWSVTWTLN